MTAVDPVRRARSLVANATRNGASEETLYARRQDLAEMKLQRAIQDALGGPAPLSDEARARMLALLAGGAR